jgi:hypothetical protein
MAGRTPTRTAARSCEGCDLCCRTYEIAELGKPMGSPCALLTQQGCAIHGSHPRTCKAFRCFWLDQAELGPEWRPSTAGFVLRVDADGVTLWLDVDPDRPGAWRLPPYINQIKRWSRAIRDSSGVVMIHDGGGVFVVFPETELFIPDPPRGARFQAGYRAVVGGVEPWAAIMDEPAPRERLRA